MKPHVVHGTIGLVMIAIFFSLAGLVAYILYGASATRPSDTTVATSTATSTSIASPTQVPDLGGTVGALFVCAGGKALKAAFTASSVALSLSDGRSLLLPQVISGSGARYANPDESFVFWNKGDTAFIMEGAVETYSDCITSQ